MPYQVGPGDPQVTLDILEFERKAATFFKANAITTNAQRDTFLAPATVTQAQMNAFLREFLKCLNLSAAPP